jgi:hypothetical protein
MSASEQIAKIVMSQSGQITTHTGTAGVDLSALY